MLHRTIDHTTYTHVTRHAWVGHALFYADHHAIMRVASPDWLPSFALVKVRPGFALCGTARYCVVARHDEMVVLNADGSVHRTFRHAFSDIPDLRANPNADVFYAQFGNRLFKYDADATPGDDRWQMPTHNHRISHVCDDGRLTVFDGARYYRMYFGIGAAKEYLADTRVIYDGISRTMGDTVVCNQHWCERPHWSNKRVLVVGDWPSADLMYVPKFWGKRLRIWCARPDRVSRVFRLLAPAGLGLG